MQYYNFDLSVRNKVNGHYPMIAQSETVGEAEAILSLDLDSQEMREAGKKLVDWATDSHFLMGFGEALYNGLFCGEVRDLYRTSLGQVHRDEDRGLRIRLCIEPPEISVLPWELLYDRSRDCFLATSIETPLTRYINLFEPIKELKTEPPINVLVAIPSGSGLDAERERAVLGKAFEESGGAIKVDVLDAPVTRSAISQALVKERYHIFHFIGHGTFQQNEGYLVINSEDSQGESDRISARSFTAFFRDYPWMKLVVLNSCQGAEISSTRPLAGMAPQLVRRGVPAVIAMQHSIADKAAILFAKEFYLKLCTGWDRGRVDTAISHARNRVQMDFPEEPTFATPVLFMRSPTGVIFNLERKEEATKLLTPAKDVHRLAEVKKAHEINVTTLKKTEQTTHAAAVEEIAKEEKEIRVIERKLRTTVLASLSASSLVLLAAWIGLFNALKLDDWAENKLIGYTDAFVNKKLSPDIALIMADEKPDANGPLGKFDSSWRQYHAKLIEALAKAGAKVVAFDFYFEEPSEWDSQFGSAIKQATNSGLSVIVGARDFDMIDDKPTPRITAGLRNFILDKNWGLITVGVVSGSFVRGVKLAEPIKSYLPEEVDVLESRVVPSFGLQAVAQAGAGGRNLEAIFSKEKNQLQLRDSQAQVVKAIPLDKKIDLIIDAGDPIRLRRISRPYHEVYQNRDKTDYLREVFNGKIVLVGQKTEEDLWLGLDIKKRYGVEIHASAISNILQDDYIRRLRMAYQALILVLMSLTAALLQTRFRNWMRYQVPLALPKLIDVKVEVPVSLLVVAVVYLFVAFLACKQYRLVFDVTYHLAALFLTYWMIELSQTRASLRRI